MLPVFACAQRVTHVRSRDLLLGALVENDHLVARLAHALELRPSPLGEEPQILRDSRGHVRGPELGLVHGEGDHVRVDPLVLGNRRDHQQPLHVAERVRLGQVSQRVARLFLDPLRIGIRDADEHLVGLRGRTAQIFQVPVVEGLEAPVNHPATHSTKTPAPSSTRPILRMKSRRASNSASSAAPRSAGSETSRPPAVCGS